MRHNLTSRMLAQLRMFDEGGIAKLRRGGGRGVRPKRLAHIVQDEGVESARWSSIKFANGDVRCAVRLLCSTE